MTRERQAAAKRGKTGPLANHWKGGRWKGGGHVYPMIRIDGVKKYVHRHIAELALGRALRTDEEVHHVDMDRQNNVPENLIVLLDQDHTRLHQAMLSGLNFDQRQWLVLNKIAYIEVANA